MTENSKQAVDNRSNAQSGFTIIELMIATAVLSTMILTVTILMTNIGDLLYKGINQARVQDDVRSITDQVASDLKYNSGGVQAGSATSAGGITVQAYCIGNNIRYSYVVGYKIGSGTTDTDGKTPLVPHVLWRDDGSYGGMANSSSPTCDPVDVTSASLTNSSGGDTSGEELIAPNSRLTDFTVSLTSPYSISVGVAYGDIDLLNLNGINSTCNGGTGDRFCATSSLQTTVVQRVSGGS